MGFNFGAFANGLSTGIENASTLQDQALSRQLKQQQLQEYLNAQASQRAFTNMAIPGASAMPGTPQQPGSGLPTMAQLPIIGPIARGMQSAGDAFSNFFGPSQPQGAAMPPMPSPGGRSDMASGPPSLPGSGGGAPAGDQASAGAPPPAAAGMPGMQTMQMVATAIDKANPGLRQSNPQAFAAAVQMGTAQVQNYIKAQMEAAKSGAEISHLGAQTEAEKSKIPLNEAHGELYKSRAANPPTGSSVLAQLEKRINTQLTQNGVMLRHYEGENNRLLQAPVKDKNIKAQIVENKKYIDALRIRQKDLMDQLPATKSTPEGPDENPGKSTQASAPAMQPVPAAKQTVLNPFVDKMVALGGDPEKTTRLVKYLRDGGMPQNEINHILMTTKARLSGVGSGKSQDRIQADVPIIPMSQ